MKIFMIKVAAFVVGKVAYCRGFIDGVKLRIKENLMAQ